MLGSNFYLKAVKTNIYIYMYIFCFPSHGVQICGAATENLRLQPSRDIAKTLERRQRERDSSLAPFLSFS